MMKLPHEVNECRICKKLSKSKKRRNTITVGNVGKPQLNAIGTIDYILLIRISLENIGSRKLRIK